MSYKKDISLETGEKIGQEFLSKTKDLYKKYLLAGSVRRREPIVHDVDFAVMPKGDNFGIWKGLVTKRVEEIGGNVQTFGEVISNFRYRGIQVNLFLCLDEDAWGVTQMWATGPKGHTIGMTKSQGQGDDHKFAGPLDEGRPTEANQDQDRRGSREDPWVEV